MNKSSCLGIAVALFFLLIPQGLSGQASSAKTVDTAVPDDTLQADLFEMADFVIEQIGHLETEEDVVCWSSFCKLDNFIARKPHSPKAVLAKIHYIQILADRIWEKASLAAEGRHVTPEDLAFTAEFDFEDSPVSMGPGAAETSREIGSKDFSDYRTTSERWRILLSVIQDAACGLGLYRDRPVLLKPLTREAALELSAVVSSLSLEMLKEAARIAFEEKILLVDGWCVHEATKSIEKRYGLEAPPTPEGVPTTEKNWVYPSKLEDWRSPSLESAPTESAPSEAPLGEREKEFLHELTTKMIHQKIQSLKKHNKGAVEEDLEQFINSLSSIPVTSEAIRYLLRELEDFFISLNSASASTMLHEIEAYEKLNRALPHSLLLNGDVVLTFGPKRGTHREFLEARREEGRGKSKKVTPSDITTVTLIERDMDSMRDNAIHWKIMQDVWLAGKGKPLTPFAAEFISEAVSVLATYYLVEAEKLAEAENKTAITDKEFSRFSDWKDRILPPEVRGTLWDERRALEKAALLKAHRGPLFKDVTQASGIDFLHELNAKTLDMSLSRVGMPKFKVGGTAVGDVDGDGRLDVYLVSGNDNKLYKNLGDGTFRDVTEEAGAGDSSQGIYALFADVDGDADLDLFIANAFGVSRLLENDGAGHFTDITARSAITAPPVPGMAFFFDFDKDGDLDMFVSGYGPWDKAISPTLSGRNGYPNKLFENLGGARFADITEKAGLGDTGWGQAAAAFDFDQDGDEDIYVANDFGANELFENLGDGTFRDISKRTLSYDRGHGMNVSFVDVNGDGFWDVYVTNISMFSRDIRYRFPRDQTSGSITDAILYGIRYLESNRLYVNKKGKLFVEEADLWFEPGTRGWSWQAGFFDYENDGDDDMYLANGWKRGMGGPERNQFFLNHNGYYYHMDTGSPESFPGDSRSFVYFDMDDDGDLDLIVNNFEDKAKVFRNEQKSRNRWLKLRLRGGADNRNGVGAKITVRAGELVMRKHVTCGLGYLSQEPEILHFGLGQNDSVDEILVEWPNGTRRAVSDVATNTLLTIEQEGGEPAAAAPAPTPTKLAAARPPER